MTFIITNDIAKEIKKFCEHQYFEENDERNRTTCRYCPFNKEKCLLHDKIIGFPSDWNV